MEEKLQPHKDVVSRRVGDEVVLVHLETDQMYSLNATGARTWELLSEGCDAETIESTLADEFGVDRAEVRQELQGLLDDLTRAQLVQPT
jgi:Coenzyme PQQ synthesis protein D (PqqD)